MEKNLTDYAPKGTMSRIDMSIEDEYTLNSAPHEFIQDGIQYGGAKLFRINIDPKNRKFSYTDDSRNFPEEVYDAYRENYISHIDTHTQKDDNYLGAPGKCGCGGKDAIRYLASDKKTTHVTEYITTPEGAIKKDYRTIDKSNTDNEKCYPSIVDVNTLPENFLGRKIVIENTRQISDKEMENFESISKRSYRNNIGTVWINNKRIEMFDPMHLDELLRIAGVKSEKELKDGFYNNREIIWEVVRVNLIKTSECQYKALPARCTIIIINARFNYQYIDKLKKEYKNGNTVPEYIKNELKDKTSFAKKSGLYVCLGPAYIERGGNTTRHFKNSFEGHSEAQSRICFIIDDDAYKVLGGKVCKMNGIRDLITGTSPVSLYYNVEIDHLPKIYNKKENKDLVNLCKEMRSNMIGTRVNGLNKWLIGNFTKDDIDTNGYSVTLSEDYPKFLSGREKLKTHKNDSIGKKPKVKEQPKPENETICDSLETKTVEKIPIDQATVPNFIVDENQKPVKVDQKSMLYNMYDENGIILRSLDSYGKPVYTPTEHFPIGRSPLDIITNIYDYLIDSGLLTPEEVKTMNISLVSSFES